MSNENEAEKPAEAPATAHTHNGAPVIDTAMLSRAHHEGGHATVGDYLGGKVNWVNVGKSVDKKWEANITWPQLVDMHATDNDILKVIVCVVAGPVAEKAAEHEVKPPKPVRLVSQVMTQKNLTGETVGETGDVQQTAELLRRIGKATPDWVKKCEKLATDALKARAHIQKDMVEALMKHDGYLEGENLEIALGKKPKPADHPAPAP